MLVYCNECKDKIEAYKLMNMQLDSLGYDVQEAKSGDKIFCGTGTYKFKVIVADRRTGCVEDNDNDVWEFYPVKTRSVEEIIISTGL